MLILTKFLGPTNYRGARIKATAPTGGPSMDNSCASQTVSFDHALDTLENHANAAKALCDRVNAQRAASEYADVWTPLASITLVGDAGDGYAFMASAPGYVTHRIWHV